MRKEEERGKREMTMKVRERTKKRGGIKDNKELRKELIQKREDNRTVRKREVEKWREEMQDRSTLNRRCQL